LKALIYKDVDVVEVVERETPAPGAGEALVAVHAAGICGTDIAIATGKHPRAKPPLVLGHEFAGEVVALGAPSAEYVGGGGVAVGDRVTVYPLLWCGECWSCTHGAAHVCRSLRMIGIDRDGGMAQLMTVATDLLCKLPDDMPWEIGALVEPLAVGVHALEMSGAGSDDFVVVMGAGPIGLVTAIALREAGVRKILITDMSAYRLALAKAFGFEALDVGSCDAAEQVRARTGGDGADVVFEVAGSSSAAIAMTDLVRCRGTIVMESVHKTAHEVDLRAINFKEITMIGTRVYERKDYGKAIELARRTDVAPLVSHKLRLDEGPGGFELMKRGEEVCKVLLEMPE